MLVWSDRPASEMRGILKLVFSLCVCGSILSTLPAGTHAQTTDEAVRGVWDVAPQPEDGWTVGDPISLRLRVTAPVGTDVAVPQLPGQWGPFEVQKQTLLEPVSRDDGTEVFVREAVVTIWAPGDYETPSFAIHHRDVDNVLHEVPVQPLHLSVVSVLSEDDIGEDGAVEKRGLKPQAALPRPPVWPWLLMGAAVATLLFLATRWLLRRRRKVVEADAAVPMDDRFPEEIAYGELDRIESLDLPASGRCKEHYTLVTDCVRVYAEGIYHVQAMERTTGELLNTLHRARAHAEALLCLNGLLEEADLVKFAKVRPTVEHARAAVGNARGFVDISKPDRAALEAEIAEAALAGQV